MGVRIVLEYWCGAFVVEEGRKEIASLLEAGKEEFDNGNRLVALSILFEAQCVLGEMFQNEMEREGAASIVAAPECCAEGCPVDISSDLLH